MNYSVVDAKLKNLIQICKETRNFKKLAVVSFILTSNKVDEVGIKLGIRQRKRLSGEKLFEYMELINKIFEGNLRVTIFQNNHIEKIRECELLFLRNKGNIPYDYIRTMFHAYYELRKLEVPNLHKSMRSDSFLESSQFGFFSFLSPRTHKRKDSSTLKPLILQKIKEKELTIQDNLKNNFNSQQLETAIYLKTVRSSLASEKKSKIAIHGALKDNINYQKSIEDVYKFFILGILFSYILYSNIQSAISFFLNCVVTTIFDEFSLNHFTVRELNFFNFANFLIRW